MNIPHLVSTIILYVRFALDNCLWPTSYWWRKCPFELWQKLRYTEECCALQCNCCCLEFRKYQLDSEPLQASSRWIWGLRRVMHYCASPLTEVLQLVYNIILDFCLWPTTEGRVAHCPAVWSFGNINRIVKRSLEGCPTSRSSQTGSNWRRKGHQFKR